jgi:hypothetical protein
VNDLPASLRTDLPKATDIDWRFVGFAALIAAAVTVIAHRRVAPKR